LLLPKSFHNGIDAGIGKRSKLALVWEKLFPLYTRMRPPEPITYEELRSGCLEPESKLNNTEERLIKLREHIIFQKTHGWSFPYAYPANPKMWRGNYGGNGKNTQTRIDFLLTTLTKREGLLRGMMTEIIESLAHKNTVKYIPWVTAVDTGIVRKTKQETQIRMVGMRVSKTLI